MSLRLRSWQIDRALLLVVALALIVRIGYLLFYSALPDWDQLTVDNYYHHHWAVSISQGNIFGDTTYFRAPFYTYCLAGVYAIFGPSLWAARLLGLAIGLISVALTYVIGKRIFNRAVGILAAIVHSVYPVLVYFESELLLDSLFALLLQVTFLWWLRWRERQRPADALITGLWLGLAAITRPTALILIAPMVVLHLASVGSFRPALGSIVRLLIGVSLLVGAVFVRNLVVAGDPVLVASQGGINLYIGNNDIADGVSARLPEPLGYNWQLREITALAESAVGTQLRPGEVSTYWTNEAIRWMATHPGTFVKLYLTKLYYSICSREASNNRDLKLFFASVPLFRYNPLSFGILLAFAVIGIAVGVGGKSRPGIVILIAVILFYTAVVALFFFNSRFRVPLLPFYIILSAAGATHLWTRRNLRSALLLVPLVGLWLLSSYPVISLPRGGSPTGLLSKGLHHYADRNYREALRWFHRAAAVDSTFPEVNLNMGACHLRMGFADSALYYFNRERAFNPQRAKVYINLASLQLLNDQYEQAATEAERAVALNPHDVMANRVLLRAVAARKSAPDDSLTHLIGIAALNTGDDIYLLNEAAILLSQRGCIKEAGQVLRRAMRSKPPPIEMDDALFKRQFRNSPQLRRPQLALAHYQLGYLAGLSGRPEEAIAQSHRAVTLDPSLVEAYVNLVSGYLSTGQARLADSVMAVAAARFPSNPVLRKLPNYPAQ